jgi:hypothetical protein
VFIFNQSNPQAGPEFLRWFQDIPKNQSRRDQLVQYDPKLPPAWTQAYVNGTSNVERLVYFLNDQQVGCLQRPLRRHLINPVFTNFRYVGQVLLGYRVANQWNGPPPTNGTQTFVAYFDDSTSREPIRFDAFDSYGNEETFTFSEFDAGAQDSNLYVIPPVIAQICTAAPPPALPTKMKVQN